MSAVDVLEQTEFAIAGMSVSDKKRLLKKLTRETGIQNDSIEFDEGVMGGVACVRGTRIPVWLLFRARQLGVNESDLLKNYPGLTAVDLVNAWNYATDNLKEIESQIEENESDD